MTGQNGEAGRSAIYEDVLLEDMEYDSSFDLFWYYCPCGDIFTISVEALEAGERIAECRSCSLRISLTVKQEMNLRNYVQSL